MKERVDPEARFDIGIAFRSTAVERHAASAEINFLNPQPAKLFAIDAKAAHHVGTGLGAAERTLGLGYAEQSRGAVRSKMLRCRYPMIRPLLLQTARVRVFLA